MKTIADFYGIKKIGHSNTRVLKYPDIYIGVEIELENCRPASEVYQSKFWESAGDGSLRPLSKGLELRFKKPFAGKDLLNALIELSYNKRNWFLGKPTFSTRTGGHIHINITNYTLEEVSHIIANFLVFEKLFYNVGRIKFNRKQNTYCASLLSNDTINQFLYLYFKKDYHEAVHTFQYNISKYHSLFLNSGLGTLEFRMFDSSLDAFKWKNWIEVTTEFVVNSSKQPLSSFPENKQKLQELFIKLFRNQINNISYHMTNVYNSQLKNLLVHNNRYTTTNKEDTIMKVLKNLGEKVDKQPSKIQPEEITLNFSSFNNFSAEVS